MPLPPGQKGPPPVGYIGHRAKDVTEADILDWLVDDAAPDSNVALRMPPGVVGLDVDVRTDGHVTMARIAEDLGPLPDTSVSNSRGDDGGIRFFRVPAGQVWVADLGLGVEVIQPHHRYAVVAPSTHPKTGQRYRWSAGAPHVDDLPDLPAPWVERLTKRPDKRAVADPAELMHPTDAQRAEARAEIADLVRQVEGLSEGERHDGLLKRARVAGGYAAWLGPEGEQDAAAKLSAAGERTGLSRKEAASVTWDGVSYGVLSPWALSTPADDFEPIEEDSDAAEDDKAARVRAAFPLLDLGALVDPHRPPRKWLLDDVVPQGEHVSIVAPAGEGKSLLVLALAVACARGDARFLGRPFGDRPARILYIDMENSEDDWAERLVNLGVTPANVADLTRTMLPLHLPRLRGLDTEKGAGQLRDVLDAYGLSAGDLVVLDSTQRVTEGEENSNDTIRKLYNLTSADLKRRGLTVIRTDNTGHDKSRARGASAKRDDVGYSWMLIPDEQDTELFALVRSKKRAAVRDAGAIVFRRSVDADGMLSFVLATPTYVEKLAEIVDLLEELGIAPTASERAALRAVKDAQTAGEAPGWITERLIKAAHKSRAEWSDEAP